MPGANDVMPNSLSPIVLAQDSSKPSSLLLEKESGFLPSDTLCWVISDGKAGMENQCLGLAERLGVRPIVKRISLRSPWRQLSPYVRIAQRQALTADSARLVPPWPQLLIATGRASVAAALWVRKKNHGKTLCVQIQNPVVCTNRFDLVVVPQHDHLAGANVFATLGGLHRVTPAFLAAEALRFPNLSQGLPLRLIAVLIGGSNGVFRLGPIEMLDLAQKLRALHEETGVGFLITPSRRTGEDCLALLQAALHNCPACIWDGQGDNPYYAMLARADGFIVTGDSVNMLSEAASTGKPVQVYALPGGSDKFSAFHAAMQAGHYTKPFNGVLEHWAYAPLDDMGRVAQKVAALYAQKALRQAN